ncbi:C40 family peptidase [Kocuria marina]|uniref:C40 family peptidase n=1 Tax=Kocuria TaxID=57493 RepID=UPI00187574AD|nr:NlpC/P60 family protein [Kocuria marina]MCT1723572.1 NlpC/P60 family protein [Kocuria marina]MCT1735553.1 NlpC/P60 family protein [Kocuria marina]GHD87740.1 hypothetical protein GCM10007061_18740 [Kocuria marina]
MSFMKQNSARHRAETQSHLVRNTAIGTVVAGAAVVGLAAPAQASSGLIDLGSTASYGYQASTSSVQAYTASYTMQTTNTVGSAASVSTQSNRSTGGLVGTAYQGIGGAYVWGGVGFKAWDCSGFTQWVYAQNGINLPRTTWAQFAAGTPTSNPQPGDLVSQNGGSHVGIYIGNGQMISALNPSQGTQVHSVNAMQLDGYYTFR